MDEEKTLKHLEEISQKRRNIEKEVDKLNWLHFQAVVSVQHKTPLVYLPKAKAEKRGIEKGQTVDVWVRVTAPKRGKE